jgi:hypothetical protein
MKKPIIAAVLCAASVVGVSAGSAFAGEITGNGKGTPFISNGPNAAPKSVGHFDVIASECSFSGLEDGGDYEGQPAGPGHTQSFGSYGPSQLSGAEVSAAASSGDIKGFVPASSGCKGSGGGAVKP